MGNEIKNRDEKGHEPPPEEKREDGQFEAKKRIKTSPPKTKKSKISVWLKNKHIQDIKKDIRTLLKEPAVSTILSGIISNNQPYPLPKTKLEGILRDRKIRMDKHPFSELLANLQKLEGGCGIEVSLIKSAHGTFAVEPRPIASTLQVYQVNRCTFKDVSDTLMGAVFFGPSQRGLRCPLKEVEILDETKKGQSPFMKLFSTLENEVYPAVIKYRHSGHGIVTKKLLLYMPPQLNASQLFNAYGTQLTTMRDDFYAAGGKRGRPASREETDQRIRGAMIELAQKHNVSTMSVDGLIGLVATALGRKESYIRKSYRFAVREMKDAIIKEEIQKIITGLPEMTDKGQSSINRVCTEVIDKLQISMQEVKKRYLSFIKKTLKQKN